METVYYAIGIVIIVIIAVIVLYLGKKQVEGYVESRTMFNSPNFTAKSLSSDPNSDPDTSSYGSNREHFFAMGEQGYVDKMGDIAGPRVMSNGMLNRPWEEIKQSVMDNTVLQDVGETVGAGRGNNFDDPYQAYKEVQDLQEMDDTGVRSPEELEKINKQINTQLDNNHNNLLSRGGSSKAKIKLDPLGTIGVMENAAAKLPERERNHQIRAGAHAVLIPSYDISKNSDVYSQFTRDEQDQSRSGWSKNFAPISNKIIASLGDDTTESAVITDEAVAAESFTDAYFN